MINLALNFNGLLHNGAFSTMTLSLLYRDQMVDGMLGRRFIFQTDACLTARDERCASRSAQLRLTPR